MKKILVSLLVLIFSLGLQAQTKNIIDIIVIDAGHGKDDPGAVGNKQKEKDINLKYALALQKKIKANYPDITIIMTRSDDSFLKPKERAELANINSADLLISIHTNSVENTKVQGTETLIFGEDSKAELIAIELQKQYTENTKLENRKIQCRPKLDVLEFSKMPAILTEIGFISNSKDVKYLISNKGEAKIIECIYNSFVFYKKMIEEDYCYKIQLTTTTLPPNLQDIKFDKIHNLCYEKVGDKYKCYSIGYTTEKLAKKAQTLAQKNNFKDAFIVKTCDRKYKIQLLAVSKPNDKSDTKWSFVKNLEEIYTGSLYKYYSTGYTTRSEAETERDFLISKGFEGAFIIEE